MNTLETQALPQSWSWKIGLLIAAIAVTLDILFIQSPLVWVGVAGTAAVLAQFRSPISGLAVVILTCGLLNYSPFEAGVLSRLYPGNLAIMIFLLAWLLSRAAWSPEHFFPPNELNRPLLALAVVTPISMVWSRLHPDPEVTYSYPHSDVSWTTVQASQLILLITTLCLPFAVSAGIKRWKDVETVIIITGIVVAIGTVLTAGGLMFGFGGSFAILGATRAYWAQPWDSSMEPLSGLLLPFLCAGVLFGRRSLAHYRLICLLCLFCIVAVVLTFSRETWLLALCGLLMVSAAWVRSRVKSALTLVMIAIVVIAVLSSGVIGLAYRFYNPDEVYGFERIYYYATALRLFVTHPVLGVGAGNYQFFDRSLEGEAAGGIAHNQFLTIAAETGLAGLSMFVWLVVRLFKLRKKVRVSSPASGDPHEWVRVAGAAFLLVWVAECFFQEAFFATAAAAGGTHVMTIIVFPWVFVGLLLAACNLSENNLHTES